MGTSQRPSRRDTEVLLARLDSYLGTLRSGHSRRIHGIDLDWAERVAAGLRTLVIDTACSSASDRARVRAAVHCFVTRGVVTKVTGGGFNARGRARLRVLTGGRPERRVIVRIADAHDTVVNAMLRELGRGDLVVPSDPVAVS